MERLEKNAYQEKLVRGLLNSLRENKTISDVHVKNLISEVHSEIGRSLDKALIKRKADELLFTWMNSELNIVKKEMKGKRTPLAIKLKNEEAMNDKEFEIFTEKILEKVLVKESGRVRKEPEIKEERIRINTLDNIMEALSYSITYNRGDGVTGNNVAKVLGVKRINQIQIKTWVNGLSKHSVTLNVYYDGRNDKLVFREAEKDLSICCELYRKITGKEPKREYLKLLSGKEKPKVLVSKTSSAIVLKRSVVDKITIEEDSYNDLYYYVAGIIVENEYKAVDIDSMCTNLRKLGYDVSKTELQGILRKRAEFSIVRYGAAVGLNEGGWKTWDEIKEKFNPKNNIKWVDCRLSLTLEEIKNVFPETEALSMITERDGFYRVYYNGSLTELTKWIQLATISIGAENLSSYIFDQDLVKRIKTRINLLNEFMLKEELGCKLETL